MIKFGSPLYWLVTLVLAVVLLGGNYFYVNLFIKRIEPSVRVATETSMGVTIKPTWRGFWTVHPDSLRDYPGSHTMLKLKVFGLYTIMILLFGAGFIVEILLMYLVVVRLFKGGS
jgi:hypothetical protein